MNASDLASSGPRFSAFGRPPDRTAPEHETGRPFAERSSLPRWTCDLQRRPSADSVSIALSAFVPDRPAHAAPRPHAGRTSMLAAALAFACGCASMEGDPGRENPSFVVTRAEARVALAAMRENPVPLARPVVVLGGYLDPGLGPLRCSSRLRARTSGERIVRVAFPFCRDFDSCREKVIDAVDRAFPSDDPLWTTEVDVVAQSMGGVVARYAAAPRLDENGAPERRLRIKRLFTIGSPHRGADLASLPIPHPLQHSMRLGSDWIRELNDDYRRSDYELYCYCRLGDRVVGSRNAAPPGETPWWLARRFFEPSHAGSVADSRIEAEIFRRLRGEEPFTRSPPAPFPRDAAADLPATAAEIP